MVGLIKNHGCTIVEGVNITGHTAKGAGKVKPDPINIVVGSTALGGVCYLRGCHTSCAQIGQSISAVSSTHHHVPEACCNVIDFWVSVFGNAESASIADLVDLHAVPVADKDAKVPIGSDALPGFDGVALDGERAQAA